MGIRLEAAYKEPDFDDNGVPVLLANQEHTIRLFGEGFTRDMLITFTRDTGSYNDPCTLPAVRGFAVSKRWLLIFIMCKSFCLNLRNVGKKSAIFAFQIEKEEHFINHTVKAKINLPPLPSDSEGFFLCIKQDNTSSMMFIHQGAEYWLQIKTYEKPLPLWAGIIIIIVCLSFSSLFSGLNLGLMSMDKTELKILCNTGEWLLDTP